jgi:1-phosphatidylinositol-4-phosphate 5-kinase
MIKKIEHFWKGLSSDRTQISALPPEEYGDRFLKFMSGITMSPEEAARDQRDRVAAAAMTLSSAEKHSVPPMPTYLPPAPPDMRSPTSPEPNPTVEKALRKATKKEKDVAKEEQVPERKMTTSVAPSTGRANSHTVLPVVEESAEAASLGGRTRSESSIESRPFTPSPRGRQDGFTDLGPHGIGGRGPPTPPKTSYLESTKARVSREDLDKALPALPQ